MKQNLILVVILLATLSMVNAILHQLHKRATTFGPCLTGSPNAISVSIQPDPPVAGGTEIFTVSGTLKTGSITTGSKLVVFTLDSNGNILGDTAIFDICGTPGMTCPTNTFSIITKVQFGTVPPTYSIVVQILDPSNSVLACSMGTITG